jgi:hypothetical protein
MSFRLRTLIFSAFCLIPAIAGAYTPGDPTVIDTGVHTSIPRIFEGLINVLLMWSTLVASTLFLVGALMMVASAGSEEGTFSVSNGKKIMKAAVIGLAIIVGSWMILSTVVYFFAA